MPDQPAPDLTAAAPRSPRTRVGGYAILGRTIDKGRAKLHGDIGEYHYDCPLDNILFDFAGVKGPDFLEEIETGATDEKLAEWVASHGSQNSPVEVTAWSDQAEKISMHGDAELGEFFDGECQRLGLDPVKASLFDMLEADDRASFDR